MAIYDRVRRMPQTLFARQALLPDGWQRDVRLVIGEGGRFTEVTPESSPEKAQQLRGPVLPGLTNLHSHAFQAAMAGLAERAGQSSGDLGEQADNFWTWREVMYRFLARLEPDDVEAIATWLYLELLRAGYTTVVEFHYLHHAPDGSGYADAAELSLRILRAAGRAGIALTLLPVLYAHSGFGGTAPTQAQRRFVHSVGSYSRLVEDLASRLPAWPLARLGVAPHSLRAVTPDELSQVIGLAERLGPATPIHLHIAEQQGEVKACLGHFGTTPVAWLLDHAPVDSRFCLVHATHMTPHETERLAASGAVAGLCPTTEANLGDGLFDAPRYLQSKGRIGIGSDSNVCVDPFEELRMLEYGQRLTLRRRNVLADGPGRSVGAGLYAAALAGGAQAAGQPTGRIAVGARADLVVLDGEDASLLGRSGDGLLDAAVFGPGRSLVRDVLVGGRLVVEDRQHVFGDGSVAESAAAAYRAALQRLI